MPRRGAPRAGEAPGTAAAARLDWDGGFGFFARSPDGGRRHVAFTHAGDGRAWRALANGDGSVVAIHADGARYSLIACQFRGAPCLAAEGPGFLITLPWDECSAALADFIRHYHG